MVGLVTVMVVVVVVVVWGGDLLVGVLVWMSGLGRCIL